MFSSHYKLNGGPPFTFSYPPFNFSHLPHFFIKKIDILVIYETNCLNFAEIPVEFTVPLQDTTVKEHASVTLECQVSKSDAKVIWLQHGVELQPGPKYDTIDDGVVHKLVIHDVTPEDVTDYTVRVGERTSTATVSVEGGLCFLLIFRNSPNIVSSLVICLCALKTNQMLQHAVPDTRS